MDKLTLKAMAKINLGLDVVRRRPDGYHEVRMIMQTVGLYDRLTFEKTEEDALRLESSMKRLPTDGNNLIIRAASLLKEESGSGKGCPSAWTSGSPWRPEWPAEARTPPRPLRR